MDFNINVYSFKWEASCVTVCEMTLTIQKDVSHDRYLYPEVQAVRS
jgi:hypothetical protein